MNMQSPTSNIYLIGMPGSGKSKLGKRLAVYLGYTFIDVDCYIIEKEEKSINQIFETQGEAAFRLLEKTAIRKIGNAADKQVIATGGGLPCFYHNMAWMNREGITIYIEVAIPILASRIQESEDRPLFVDLSLGRTIHKLEELYENRKNYYEQAAYKIDGSKDQWKTIKSIFTTVH